MSETPKEKDVVDTETLLEWYRTMVLMRRFEDAAEQHYQTGQIAGYHHVYSGQEAVAMGLFAHLEPEDHVITAYRDHGPAIARGMDPKRAMAELFGRATGVSKGKGGSMHLASKELHFWGGYAIVAAHLTLATGIALADHYRGQNTVTVCLFGDGSTNNGYFHEALNLAKVWDLPVLFVCENNNFGMWTKNDEVSAVHDIAQKACAYSIPAMIIDGMNVAHVHKQSAEAFDYIRSGKGPYFIEAKTYRYKGHGAGDIEAYRTKEEVAEYRERDPITQLARQLTEERGVEEATLEAIRTEVEAQMKEVVQFASESPEPELDALWTDIYARPFDSPYSPSLGRS